MTYKQREPHLVLFVGLSVIVIGAVFMAAFVAAVTAMQPFQEASAQLGEIDTFLFSKTDRDLQQLLDAFETSPPNITAVITNATASEAQKYSVENMYNICLILIARSAPYGYSCGDIVETVNNNNQTRIDQEIENIRNLIAENAAKPPVQWWEEDEDEQEEDSNDSDDSDGSDDDR